MRLLHRRTLLAMCAVTFGPIAVAACGSGGGHTFTRLSIFPGEVRESTYETAFEILTHHRELILVEDRIAFRGGADLNGLDRQNYSAPILIVDGDQNMNDPITVLRRLPAGQIAVIELWRASMVPPEFRRPGWQGGVIWIRTR
jgi:hypothetical protein